MTHTLRSTMAYTAFLLISVYSSLTYSRDNDSWLAEKSGIDYYYVDFEYSEKSMKSFSELLIDGGWIMDIIGFSSSKKTRIQARLMTFDIKAKRPHFQFRKGWFQSIKKKRPIGVLLNGSAEEINNTMTSMIKKGLIPIAKKISGAVSEQKTYFSKQRK